jgi:type II secretory pathway component PulF
MATFTYTGEDRNGNKVKETVDAVDRFAVYELARQQGHTVNSVDEKSRLNLGALVDFEKINYYINRVKQDELIMLTRNLGSMLTAGLSLVRALSVIERQSSNPRLKGTITQIQERINKGDPFNEALKQFPNIFDDLYVSMVRAGEESGGLAEALQTLSLQMERASSLKKKIKGAMIYPAIVLTIMVGIGVLMMMYVMPSITDTFKSLEVDLPMTTQVLIFSSDFMVANSLLVLAGAVILLGAFIYALRTPWGVRGFSWLVVRLPIIGAIAKEANAARTARTLSSLLKSGVDVLRSLDITEDVMQNYYYKQILRDAHVQVEKGSATFSDLYTT